MKISKEFKGEALGTFILVLFGCGSVAVTVLFNAHQGLMQIALAWGIGVTLAIYLTRHLSFAHLNPAVTLAMVLARRMSVKKILPFLSGQFIGGIMAGLTVYLLFGPSIILFENAHGIVRGTPESVQTAKMFGEYYAAPGSTAVVSMPLAMAAEALGTFILLMMIFALTEGCNIGRPDNALAPLFIGLTVTSIICLIAPLTQAGLNPARDFGPRMVAWFFGWGNAAFPDQSGGFFLVYMLAPIIGALGASFFFLFAFEPTLKKISVSDSIDSENE